MADKRISQLVDRGTVANNDVVPIVVSGASTTNKATISSIQTFMQGNLDMGVTSVGLSMPSAFVVSNSPVTASGNISVTGAGTVSQYIRGDGSLADFPSGGGGGGSSVNYYLNGSVSQGTIGGIAYQEMNKVPVLGAGTDFTIAADGYIASFITDAGDPALLEIPAGNWNFETYLQASSGGGTPSFYIELYKVDSGGTATLIASNSGSPELIAFGTTTTPYFSALAVPTTSLTLTDRLALRYYVTHSGRTITLHTENATLCQIITTFTTGLTALNGLTAQVQNFATGTSGTDFAISSSVSTHTFNLPNASASARGVVTTGSQIFAGAKTFNSDIIVNGITVGKGIGANNGNNTAIGLNCLSSNTTGTLNTATGLSALQYNTAGNSNTANGANSLLANTTGGFNTASGNQSLYSNTTGQANTAIGINSLYSNTTGTYNIGVGSGAGYYIADGSTPNTTSDFSIYLGADTKASVDNAQNEVVIGYNAIGSGSNTVTIGNSSITDNYFTGTIRSTALRLAAAGTADTTIFRNTSGTSSSTGSANVVGFNGSNNIFVTTNSKGGFLLDFNNSVSNRTYTLQDASGTLAFTSQIPSVVGVYLPLTGGTLTGALNGTSASFSGGTGAINFTNSTTITNTASSGFTAIYANGGGIYLGGSASTNHLSISSTGAATFSSTLQTGGDISLMNSSGDISLKMKDSGGNADRVLSRQATTNNVYLGDIDANGGKAIIRANGEDYLTILTTGNVGIGTASPVNGLSSSRTLNIYGTSGIGGEIVIEGNSGGNFLSMNAGTSAGDLPIVLFNRGLRLGHATSKDATGFAETMRITSGGYLKASNTGSYLNGSFHEVNSNTNDQEIFYNTHFGSSPYGRHLYFEYSPNNNTNYFERWRDGNATRARLYSNGGLANYQANNVNLSDERTKKDIEPLESYWDKFKAIEIVKFKYKDQTHDDFNIGVIAQQVEEVAPEFVDVDGWDTKPELDEEGNEIVSEEEPLKSIYTADLYHATIKVLQEAMAKIEKLETEIDSLKNQMQ